MSYEVFMIMEIQIVVFWILIPSSLLSYCLSHLLDYTVVNHDLNRMYSCKILSCYCFDIKIYVAYQSYGIV
jgi:hypothetical protein